MKARGFTLVELIVVIGIISLLSSIVLASLGNARAKARDARRLADMHNIRTALELYKSTYGMYPEENADDCGGFDAGYDGSEIPPDTNFIQELVNKNIFSQTPGDPLSTGCGIDDYVYKYERSTGNALCPAKSFYILAIKNFETLDDSYPSNPGFECAAGSQFDWVTGGFED